MRRLAASAAGFVGQNGLGWPRPRREINRAASARQWCACYLQRLVANAAQSCHWRARRGRRLHRVLHDEQQPLGVGAAFA